MAWQQQQAWQPQVRPQASWQANNARPAGVAAGAAPGAYVVAPSKVAPRFVPAGAAAPAGPETYVVFSRTQDNDEVVVKTLVGEFVEAGRNHERKFFKKVPTGAPEAVDVFLYYWDSRDGPAFEGWWFGNKLGGTQVWSHCTGSSLTPPKSGWKIPWDGQIRPSLAVELKKGHLVPPSQSAASAGGVMGNPLMEVATAAKKALQQAQTAHGGTYSSLETIQAAEEIMQGHPQALAEALKKLMEGQRGAVGEQQRQFAQMGTIIRATQGQVNQEMAKLGAAKSKCEQADKLKASEEKDANTLAEVMPEATQKTNVAEDAVEKAVITAEMITAANEDIDEVRQAVAQTEAAAQEAQKAIGEARIFLNAKMASCRRFETETIRQRANEQLRGLLSLLQECQNKLNPLKNVRQDFVQRTAAKKLVEEILEKLSPAEVDVDRAEEAAMLLSSETMNKETIQQASQAVTKASDHVNSVVRFITSKKTGAVGIVRDELSKLEERAKQSQERLAQLSNQHKESTEKIVCGSLLQEAAEKLQSVAETVAKAADAESPFLTGVEDLPLEETLAAVKVCETASTSANTAVSIARMFIATKLVEAKRFTAAASKEAQAKLKEYQAELETHTKKLTELKKATAVRKKAATMREAESEVAKAEDLARQVGEIASVFSDDTKLLELSAAEIREACEKTLQAEQAANAALADARKFITARQIESKGKEMSTEVSSELIKYQTRLSTAQADVGKYKKLCGSVEGRLAAKKVIEDAAAKVNAAEEKVEKASELVNSMDEAEASSSSDAGRKTAKAAESAAAEAQVALKTAGRFLDSQTRASGLAKEEIAKMKPRIEEAQEKLNEMIASMKEKSEKIIVDGIIKESEERVKEAEDSVSKVAVAEQPFLKGVEDIPVEEASKLLAELDSVVQAAHTAVGGAKTFLAMKRLAAKRLSEASAEATQEELTTLQSRLDAVAKRMSETKKGMAERKMATVKREAEAKVSMAEQKVQQAVEATEALTSDAEMAPEAMKGACEKAGTTQHEAQVCIQDTKSFLQTKQRDAKLIASDSSMPAEVAKMLERLNAAVSTLDKQKAVLRDQEHKFVAQRLLKDAVDQVENLEAVLQNVIDAAEPLISEKGDFSAGVFLSHAVAAVKTHMKNASKTPKSIFEEIGEKGPVTAAKFVAFMEKLPELTEQKDLMLSAEQLTASFARMDTKGGGEVNEEEFLEHFRTRYLVNAVVSMTDGIAVKGGKTVRKLEVNEVVEELEEPTKEPGLNLMRVKARTEKDGKEGYITLSGTSTTFLVPYDPIIAMEKKVEQAMQELVEAGSKTQKYVDTKVEELKSVHKGPLAETKTALLGMGPRIRKVQHERKSLKSKIAESRKKQQEAMENEKKRRQEALDRAGADKILEEVNSLVGEAEEKVEKAVEVAQALVSSRGAESDKPLEEMDSAEKDLLGVEESINKALAKIKEHLDGIKNATKGPFSEARTTLVKVKVKVGSLDSKCKKQVLALASARKQVTSDAEIALKDALRKHVVSKAMKPDELFKELAQEGQAVSAQRLRSFIEAIPDSGLKSCQFDLGIERLALGLTKLTLLDMLQEYQRCVKDIAITTAYEVKESKTIRKLLIGELVEVLEARKEDGATSLSRVRCRALQDHKEGWATLKGNQGTAFMEKTSKPYFCCDEAAVLQAGFESSSAEVGKVQPGEVLEVLEGPRQEDPLETQRVKAKASKDGKIGWATLKDLQGRVILEPAKLLLCKQSIAITTTFDIAEGKALRKLEVGEALEVVEGPKEDPVRSLTRVKARAKTDGKEGWVTLKGNQGTSYADETDKHYICNISTPLERRFASGSEAVRELEQGEVVEIIDGPKAETKEGAERVRGRNVGSGEEGWFTLAGKNFQPWAPRYKCMQSTVINDALAVKEAKAIRKLEVGEVLEALEAPILEKVTGLLRIRVRAQKDGASGFATVRGNQGTVMMKPIISGSSGGSSGERKRERGER
mmetsp:Transcript_35599/g.94158  ORF Transcript_35599/g.94158 Transcript_35599/m.94158 type:complete len:1976 (+) Transcript_35599:140-6067(+)